MLDLTAIKRQREAQTQAYERLRCEQALAEQRLEKVSATLGVANRTNAVLIRQRDELLEACKAAADAIQKYRDAWDVRLAHYPLVDAQSKCRIAIINAEGKGDQ